MSLTPPVSPNPTERPDSPSSAPLETRPAPLSSSSSIESSEKPDFFEGIVTGVKKLYLHIFSVIWELAYTIKDKFSLGEKDPVDAEKEMDELLCPPKLENKIELPSEKEEQQFFDAEDGEIEQVVSLAPVATEPANAQPEMLIGEDDEDKTFFDLEEREEEKSPPLTPLAVFEAIAPLPQKWEEKVSWFFKTMAQESALSLGMTSRRNEIKQEVDGIGSEHPLKLLEYVLKNEQTLKELKAIPGRWGCGQQIWGGCAKMFGDAIVWHLEKNPHEFMQQFIGFVEKYQLDSDNLFSMLNGALEDTPPDWAKFLKIVFSIPV